MLDLSNLRSAVACRSSTSRPAVHQPLPDCYSHTTEDNTVDKLVVGDVALAAGQQSRRLAAVGTAAFHSLHSFMQYM